MHVNTVKRLTHNTWIFPEFIQRDMNIAWVPPLFGTNSHFKMDFNLVFCCNFNDRLDEGSGSFRAARLPRPATHTASVVRSSPSHNRRALDWSVVLTVGRLFPIVPRHNIVVSNKHNWPEFYGLARVWNHLWLREVTLNHGKTMGELRKTIFMVQCLSSSTAIVQGPCMAAALTINYTFKELIVGYNVKLEEKYMYALPEKLS